MSEYVVELKNCTKIFPGVKALDKMQLAVKPGASQAYTSLTRARSTSKESR